MCTICGHLQLHSSFCKPLPRIIDVAVCPSGVQRHAKPHKTYSEVLCNAETVGDDNVQVWMMLHTTSNSKKKLNAKVLCPCCIAH